MNIRLCKVFVLSLTLVFSTFSTTFASIGDFNGKVDKKGMVISGAEAISNFAKSEIYNNPAYAPIQTQLPKPTHYFATTPTCDTSSFAEHCALRSCAIEENPGIIQTILTKPIDQVPSPPEGTGTEIDSNNLDALKQWDWGGTFCTALLPRAKGAVLSEALDFQTEDLQEHGLVGSKVNGPKNNGLTLIKYNTNIWAEPQEQTINTTILDVPVQARAVPKEYVFDYGDGTPLQTRNVPGHFLRDDEWDEKTATTHVYEETGTFQANVMTVYEAEMSVNGGEWLPMTGQAEVWGNPVPVDVWRTDTYLVDGKKSR